MTKQNNDTSSDRPPFTNEQIAAIYPTAKTYDEKLNDRRRREASRPKINLLHLTFTVSVRTYALVMLLSVVIFLIPQLITWNPISGVFFAFLLALIWIGAVYLQLSSIGKPFYLAGLNLTVFVLLYCLVAALAVYVLLLLASYMQNSLLLLLLATVVHFVLSYVIMTLLIKGKKAAQN